MRHFHLFGCPVYVLNSKMASGNKLPKWDDRTWVAIYLGKSPNHARSVSLVLSLSTGMVSPQYHCRFDDLFETVSGKGVLNIPESKWQEKAHFVNREEDAKPEQAPKPKPKEQGELTRPTAPARAHAGQEEEPTAEALGVHQEEPAPPQQGPEPTVRTRSGRAVRKPQSHQDFVAYQAINEWQEEDELEDKHPLMTYKATADPDTMYLHEAMRQPDKAEFLKAMEKEMTDHMPHWEL